MKKLSQEMNAEVKAGIRICAFNVFGIKLFCYYT
ncbi:hypothetical protein A5888_002721 [Enterococcus sp. 9E7_DIV0242]|uniref:Uncharacterized protein n=1 Tax=Candidatus Enterococcus clewellii TaxID=1834193 RepID=A0A242K847_9ENTE|nr:hypothetical protein A5888_001482 [Enterococcus sp. 9E7_DIV0242]